MTEKRFVAIGVEWTDGFIQDHISDRDLFNIGAVCNLLNDLSEENEQLKIDIGIAEDNHKLDKEIIDDIHNEYQKVKKENKQLKETVEEMIKIFDDSGLDYCLSDEMEEVLK